MSRTRSVSKLEPRKGADSAHLLEVQNLKTHFITARGRVRAVDGVSFALERGKTIGIVGESGSGKTVLSRSIMNLLPRSNVVRDGKITFEGRDITGLDAKSMREIWGIEIAMVFQDPMTSLNPVVKIGRQITESLRFHLDLDKKEAKETAIALLRSVNIPEPEKRINEYPHQLSGGMRQRVTIAIALACGPKLLMADEPTTALDVTVQAQILNLLARQQRERDMGMVLVTHDLGVVAGRTDEIIVMYGGKVVEQAPTAVLFDQMKMPYTEALMRSIPKLEDHSHTRLKVIGGRPPDLINPPKGCNFSPRCPYAQPKCHEEEPPLIAAEAPGHQYACWFPVGTPENRAAYERNLEAKLPQTLVTVEGAGAGAAVTSES
ncbi:ABC transporter ATP-binding protein [Actinomarinicola tropica]|uniref:ATP-binding cassette domain-containing protein n=1 Tax=Actinomarinicola tropica TaxID=2789776 RepID=A0A5Q2RQ61_9ACTN|nr:ABC transporter ATP-binding protein [Actinomarinicola tropica]QGG95345.1 ATP-binding cassette domain-containing protein [Actinomarinicola tropica]